MTAPLFLAHQDDDELDDLASVGVDLARPMGEPEIDALASECLGRMAWYTARIAEADEAERMEIERIRARYARRTEPLHARHAHYEQQALALAERATFAGKKKSRTVGNGVIGRKTEPERVRIVDAGAALEYALAACPEAVREKVTTTVDHKVIAPVVLEHLHETGEVVPGFEHTAARETCYARVEVSL